MRAAGAGDPALAQALRSVKRVQSRRFAGFYADLLAAGPYAPATRFFLEELYGEEDFSQRDAQFARIAGAVERFFPADVVRTAVALAQLHVLTEQLDFDVARAWPAGVSPATLPARPTASALVGAWRAVGRRPDRLAQLAGLVSIGDELIRLTRLPGLKLMLRMMRGPARAAGLDSLQRFLETGFDIFALLSRRHGSAESFLQIIRQRESEWIEHLFGEPFESSVARAQRALEAAG